MGSQEALLSGASIGLAVAAPIGPMAVMVIRRTLAGGFLAGIATGAGASTVHLFYATLTVCGLDQIATHVASNKKLFNILFASALVLFAVRMLRPRAARTDAIQPVGHSLLGNYASAIMINLMNPMGFALLLSAIAAIAGLSSNNTRQTCSLAAGVFAGSIAWWVCLVGSTALVGIRLSPRSIRMIDIAAGVVMFALAAATMSRIV